MLCYGMKVFKKQPLSRRYNVCKYFTNMIILKYKWNNDKRKKIPEFNTIFN